MIHVSNLIPTSALKSLSPYEASTGKTPIISHLRVLRLTVYVFIHEEEKKTKSAKLEPRRKRSVLVGYDGHAIYRIYLAKDEKVI